MAQPKEIDALTNPLAVDKQTVKEFNIKPEDDVSPRRKIAFLQAQLEELESTAWRERVNIIHATRLQQSPNEALRLKGNSNMTEHKNVAARVTEAIPMTKTLIAQLREEYPELQAEE